MNEIVLRTEEFEIEIAKGHSLYFAELDKEGKPVRALYLEGKELEDLLARS